MMHTEIFPEKISINIFLDMFPFYLSLDREGKISSIGPSLKKACPDLNIGQSAMNFFECKSPANGLDIETLGARTNHLYIIRHIQSETIYRGSKVFTDSSNQPFLAIKPWINKPEDLRRLNLTINDFPVHDQTLDIIQLVQTHRIAVADVNTLNEALFTEQKTLKQQRDELDWIYKNVPIGLAVFDIDGRYIHINEYLARINNLSVEGHIGKRIHDILPFKSQRFDRARDAIFLSRSPLLDQENEIRFPSDPSQKRHFKDSWYPVFTKDDEISGFGVLVEETTDKKSAEALREADKRKNQFLAALSHELRNPVATIGLSIDIIKDRLEASTTEATELSPFIDRADRQLKHLTRLLDDLLEVSRITQGKIDLKLTRVDIGDILRTAIDLSLHKIQSSQHQLILHWPDSKIMVCGDPERLTQIFANLIDNAVKYTDTQGKIEISITAGSKFAKIIIKDNGLGIKPENLANIFEMFYQIKSSHEKRGLGLGIGLALVQQLVKLHSGLITVKSDGEGQGSMFTVELPLL